MKNNSFAYSYYFYFYFTQPREVCFMTGGGVSE